MKNHNLFAPFNDIFEEHVDEASWLWFTRTVAVTRPEHNLITIKKIEQRLHNHLTAFRISPDYAWGYCQENFASLEDAEILFVMASIALQSGDVAKVNTVLKALHNSDITTLKGFTSALAWQPPTVNRPWISGLLRSSPLIHQYLAIATCSLQREDAGDYLATLLGSDKLWAYQPLCHRALRLVGELKRHDLLPLLQRLSYSDFIKADHDSLFWVNWSRVLLGDSTALPALKPAVMTAGAQQARAIAMAFRCLPLQDSHRWIDTLAKTRDQSRETIQAIATLGDPQAIEWLIERMREPGHERLAGQAFTTITGIDLVREGLTKPSPADDMDDDDAEISDDDHLPWPDVDKVMTCWQQIRHRFTPGQRVFLGLPPDAQHLTTVLTHGSQFYRQSAALEYALLQPDNAYVNTKAKVLEIEP